MGTFISNIHIFSSSDDKADQYVSFVKGFSSVIEDEYELTQEAESSDREVRFLSTKNSPWLTILDSELQGYDLEHQFNFARQISKKLLSVVMSVFVHDSDILVIGLFRSGRRIDTILQDNGLLNESENLFESIGKPTDFRSRVWDSLLDTEVSPISLRSLKCDSPFVEDFLEEISKAIRLPVSNALSSCFEEPEDFDSMVDIYRVYYKSKTPPLYQRVTEGVPHFACVTHIDERKMQIGEELQTSFTVVNKGGESKGLIVLVWGDAVDNKLVEISELRVVKTQNYLSGKRNEILDHLHISLAYEEIEGQDYLVAKLPDFIIPPGIGDLQDTNKLGQIAIKYFFDAMAREIYVNPIGKTLRPGKGTLNLTILPQENSENGQITQSTTLNIS